jgi:hypothetical protein
MPVEKGKKPGGLLLRRLAEQFHNHHLLLWKLVHGAGIAQTDLQLWIKTSQQDHLHKNTLIARKCPIQEVAYITELAASIAETLSS